MLDTKITFVVLFISMISAGMANAKDYLRAYFSNDSLNGLKLSDAYESHNMGLLYSTDTYYLNIDLGIVTPDMYVYRNEYRKPNRSFGELISLEIGKPYWADDDYGFYARIRGTGKFGIDKLQDFAHRLLSLQPVNKTNNIIRMPGNVWVGLGVRKEFKPIFFDLEGSKINLDGFLGSDTAFLTTRLKKEFKQKSFRYDLSLAARFVAYDKVVSAPPVNAKERNVIPEVSFGVIYDNGPYSVFVRDTFSLPSIGSDNDVFGVLSAGLTYTF